MDPNQDSEREPAQAVSVEGTGRKIPPRNIWAIISLLLPIVGLCSYCLIPVFRMHTGMRLGGAAQLSSVAATILGVMGICYAAQHGGSGRSRACLGILLGITVLVLAFPATMSLPRERANRVKCASGLRQIGQAIELYAEDNAGQFPSQLGLLVTHCDLEARLLVCPSSDDAIEMGLFPDRFRPEPRSHVYLGAGFTISSARAETVIAYESVENHYGEGMNILYGDGHVGWVLAKDAERIVRELKAGRNPPGTR